MNASGTGGLLHPGRMGAAEAGAVVVDGCIFGPPPGGQPPARLYLAGIETASRRIADLFTGTLVQPVVLGEQSGQASALKALLTFLWVVIMRLPGLGGVGRGRRG